MYSVPVLQVCDGMGFNDFDTWIFWDFGYLMLHFSAFGCKKINTFNLIGSVCTFSDHYKMASPIKLLQNEGARPPIEALFSEARKSLSCFKLQAGP